MDDLNSKNKILNVADPIKLIFSKSDSEKLKKNI